MQEIEVKENSLNVKVFINGIPELKNIPKEKAESILAALELEISEQFRSKNKSNSYKSNHLLHSIAK